VYTNRHDVTYSLGVMAYTLTVNGNLTFQPGSTYSVEVNSAGSNDRANATGTLTTNRGAVSVLAGAGTYSLATRYTILNATGGRTGTCWW